MQFMGRHLAKAGAHPVLVLPVRLNINEPRDRLLEGSTFLTVRRSAHASYSTCRVTTASWIGVAVFVSVLLGIRGEHIDCVSQRAVASSPFCSSFLITNCALQRLHTPSHHEVNIIFPRDSLLGLDLRICSTHPKPRLLPQTRQHKRPSLQRRPSR